MNTYLKILLVIMFTIGLALLFAFSVGAGFKSIISSLPTVSTITLPSIDFPTSQQTSTPTPRP
jgi:hypothetical protein